MILLKGTENVDNYTMISILSKHTRICTISWSCACRLDVSGKRTFCGHGIWAALSRTLFSDEIGRLRRRGVGSSSPTSVAGRWAGVPVWHGPDPFRGSVGSTRAQPEDRRSTTVLKEGKAMFCRCSACGSAVASPNAIRRSCRRLPDQASHPELGVCPDPHHLQRILTAPSLRYAGAKSGRRLISI